MIPCPYCERGFEKRAGLMRHVTSSHHSEGVVPVNPGGAIEAVVPVEVIMSDAFSGPVDPETYAESLTDDQLVPGQEPYVDPPSGVTWDQEAYNRIAHDADRMWVAATGLTEDVWHERSAAADEFVADTVRAPTSEQYTRIRALRRQGHQEAEAWMTVVGYPPPQRDVPAEDLRPLRLQQIAFRVGNGYGYGPEAVAQAQMDATWLLRLAEIGRDAVAQLHLATTEYLDGPEAEAVVDRWNETIA